MIPLTGPLTFVRNDDVHDWSGGSMDDGDQPGGLLLALIPCTRSQTHHEFHNVDPEMLILHRVQSDPSLTQAFNDRTVRCVDYALDVCLEVSTRYVADFD